MSEFMPPTGFSTPESEMLERVHRSEAVANVHAKLLEARSIDAVLRDNDRQGSYRYAQMVTRAFNGIQRQHSRVVVRPSRSASPKVAGDIQRIILDCATEPKERADEHSLNVYYANVLAQQISVDGLRKLYDMEPVLVPSQTVLGQAVKRDGSSMRFVLSPDNLQAYSDKSDVLAVPTDSLNFGQEYTVASNAVTSALQSEMLGQWFDAKKLNDVIAHSEPFLYDDQADSHVA